MGIFSKRAASAASSQYDEAIANMRTRQRQAAAGADTARRQARLARAAGDLLTAWDREHAAQAAQSTADSLGQTLSGR